MEFTVNDINDTFSIGRQLGEKCKAGDIICLDGDLGAGKTHFTKGIASGLGIEEDITSPTFTIVNEYDGGRLKLNHFDVYRVNDPDEIEAIGFDEYIFGQAVSVIEWASYIDVLIPENALSISIIKLPELGENFRKIVIKYSNDRYAYVKEIEI